jgi:hypothetical protein
MRTYLLPLRGKFVSTTSAPAEHHVVVMTESQDPTLGYKTGDEVLFCDLFSAGLQLEAEINP